MPTPSLAFEPAGMRRVAVISLHTSPLLQPGSGDSGGMNVYVREIVSSLAQAGLECTTYTRADHADLRRELSTARFQLVGTAGTGIRGQTHGDGSRVAIRVPNQT